MFPLRIGSCNHPILPMKLSPWLGRAIIQFFPWNLAPECLPIASPRLAGRRFTAPHASVRVWRSSGTWHETHHVDKAMGITRASSLWMKKALVVDRGSLIDPGLITSSR
jgi:hypothetical protein